MSRHSEEYNNHVIKNINENVKEHSNHIIDLLNLNCDLNIQRTKYTVLVSNCQIEYEKHMDMIYKTMTGKTRNQ